jgi:tRNA(Ile)-lysidine synthetase-like protein
MITWKDIKFTTLQKMFSISGSSTVLPNDSANMEYINAMPQACNEALQLLSTAGKFIIKEYEYITLIRKVKKVIADSYAMKVGKIKFAGEYEIEVKRSKLFMLRPGIQLMDTAKIPSGAKWRVRQKGDKFEKFGGGTKPLRTYLIDKKVPARLRDTLPVLAKDDETHITLHSFHPDCEPFINVEQLSELLRIEVYIKDGSLKAIHGKQTENEPSVQQLLATTRQWLEAPCQEPRFKGSNREFAEWLWNTLEM